MSAGSRDDEAQGKRSQQLRAQPCQTPKETARLLAHMADWLIDTFVDFDAPVKAALGIVGNQWWDYTCYWPGCRRGESLPAGDHPESITAQCAPTATPPPAPAAR